MDDCRLFEEDEVCVSTPDRGVLYGLVTQNSEYVSSDEFSDDEDVSDRVKRGTVQVTWHPSRGGKAKEAILPENTLCLADRSLMPGDVVRRLIEGKDSQRGYVIETQGTCHLRVFGTNKYIYNVDTRDLIPLHDVDTDPGDVTMDSWVGKVDTLDRNLILRFPDGAKCEVCEGNLYSYTEVFEKHKQADFFTPESYPGQILRGKFHEMAGAKWIKATNRFNLRTCMRKPLMMVTVYVEDVFLQKVRVQWMCKGFSKVENTNENFDPPPEVVMGENLKRLRPLEFHHCSVQLGDRCFYVIKPSDVLETSEPCWYPPLHIKDLLGGSGNMAPPPPNTTAQNEVSEVRMCRNENGPQGGGDVDEVDGDVDWEIDDSSSDDESHHSTDSWANSANKRKSPRKKGVSVVASFKLKTVGKRAQKDLPFPEMSTNVGDKVPVDVRYTYSLATIMWQDGTLERNVSSADLYPIHHLDELEFFPGDFVTGNKDAGASSAYGVVVKCNHSERTCVVRYLKPYEVGHGTEPIEVKPACEVSVYDLMDHPYYKFRPGHVVIRVGGLEGTAQLEAAGLVKETNPDGRITVRWADDSVSTCYPQELYISAGDLSELGSGSGWTTATDSDGEGSSDQSWETEEEEQVPVPDTTAAEEEEDSIRKHLASLTKADFEASSELLSRSWEVLERVHVDLGTLNHEADPAQNFLRAAEILHDICKTGKDMDKLLKTSHFKEVNQLINDLLRTVKREFHREESLKVSRFFAKLLTPSKGEQESKAKVKQDIGAPAVNGNPAENDTNGACPDRVCTGAECGTDGARTAADRGTLECKVWAGHKTLTETRPDETCADSKLKQQPSDDLVLLKKSYQMIYGMLKKGMECMQGEFQAELRKRGETVSVKSLGTSQAGEGQANGCKTDQAEQDAGAAAAPSASKHILADLAEGLFNLQELRKNNSMCAAESDDSPMLSRYKEVLDVTSPTENSPSSESAANVTKGFCVCECAPSGHKLRGKPHSPLSPQAFMGAVRKELSLLKSSLPDGIFVKSFEDRMDLFSIMVLGPANTPYEDGLFFFDVQLPSDYPKMPPSFHYLSYCTERLNPNLYDDGKVCVSLLGTWSGKGNEMWTNQSNMLQVLLSIQGLILNSEPYYNEAGFEKQRGSQQGHENSKMYNEMAALKLTQVIFVDACTNHMTVGRSDWLRATHLHNMDFPTEFVILKQKPNFNLESMAAIASRPPPIFKNEARQHILATGPRMIQRLEGWVKRSEHGRMYKSSTSPTPMDSAQMEAATDKTETTGEKTVSVCQESKPVHDPDKEQTVSQACNSHSGQANGPVKVTSLDSGCDRVIPPEDSSNERPDFGPLPEFPVLPASKGFCMAIGRCIKDFRKAIGSIKES